jgi:two-component system, chemotaxis family, chemotaxis protein CheY
VELRIPADVFLAYSLCRIEIDFMEQMKVLIIDDNENVRLLLRDYLPASVDEIYECMDGGEAFALYQKHRPDWVLMDWEMPNMNGITAIRQIIAEFPKAHICMVTAFDDEAIRVEALAAGASGFVLKDNLFELEAILVDELEN